jgi:flagellar hook-basal body complex protein FliE
MTNGFFQKIDAVGHIENGPMQVSSIPSMRGDTVDEVEKPSFKGVMTGLVQNFNQELNAPDALLKKSMAGDSSVDIHDVMTAMAKAEINVNVATQVTSKVIQAYDKIMQISV